MRQFDAITSAPSTDISFQVAAVVAGNESDPFSVLGMHRHANSGKMLVRAFWPGALTINVVNRAGVERAELTCVDEAGFFAGVVGSECEPFPYRLRIKTQNVPSLWPSHG